MKDKEINIALLGADINNTNLGCQALTWSLLTILESIKKKKNLIFQYYIFEANPCTEKTSVLSQELGISVDILHPVHLGCITDPLRFIKYIKRNMFVFNQLKECDIAFDITRGDSFSDLYGKHVFDTFALYKLYLEKVGVPLVLAPQTYGPFIEERNKKRAERVFRDARYIMSRDKMSNDQVNELCGRETFVTTDVAFQLPFEKKSITSEKKRIGINISGLLFLTEKNEYNQNLAYAKKYNEIIEHLIQWLNEQNKYEIILVPHVTNDVEAISRISTKYPFVSTIEYVDNPKKIKEIISTMDVFIGSRMHATIAALSSGVPTIPLAYSRKFKGVFELLDYQYTIDLEESEDEIYQKIINSICNIDLLLSDMINTTSLIQKYNNNTNLYIEHIIDEMLF